MINLAVLKNKLPEILCSKGLTMFQTAEIIKRAIMAEKAVELLISDLASNCNMCPLNGGNTCALGMSQTCNTAIKEWYMQKAREQE